MNAYIFSDEDFNNEESRQATLQMAAVLTYLVHSNGGEISLSVNDMEKLPLLQLGLEMGDGFVRCFVQDVGNPD